ncbi:MAG: sigma-54-dependent Fis family transcriptional regulator [bacterium]|nr:sigma-54-dependent Fis family transcriptional regulator [bacterium]
MAQRSVLVVDDDAAMREMLVSLLEEQGILASAVGSADAAIETARETEYGLVISDIRMPGKDGIELTSELRRLRPETPVILMTAFGSIDSAVSAMRAGAFDYVTKPFKRDAIVASLDRAFEHRALEEENRRLRRAIDRSTKFGDLIGASPSMREIFALIRKVSGSRTNVLITGESGTGKDVVARTLHFAGARTGHPFVPINCTAMPEGLLESELFGHVRGAFTGAHTSKKGLFEEAHGGTLFLDEIGDMPFGLQGKLLRVVQDGLVRPVGGTRSIKVDVRLITATNSDLAAKIEAGEFRQDLFYRLNVIPIHIPPLRERPEDIPVLADAFLRKHSGSETRTLSPDAQERLKRMRWEGNARELENAIERALVLSPDRELVAEDFPSPEAEKEIEPVDSEVALLDEALERGLTLRQLGDLYIERVLKHSGGNKVRAARALGINRRTLYRRGEHETPNPSTPSSSTPNA